MDDKFGSEVELIVHIETVVKKKVVTDTDGVKGVELFHKTFLTEAEIAGGAYMFDRGIQKEVAIVKSTKNDDNSAAGIRSFKEDFQNASEKCKSKEAWAA